MVGINPTMPIFVNLLGEELPGPQISGKARANRVPAQ
jgi:hypothetical protein